ncbi:MAG: nucleotidyltransferase [Candidatus Edwardsbacteria bacterium]|nr:nucleotidyltransferase [Candidatus Edwardsbacteria bacterium]
MFPQDFKEFIELLNARGVEYLVVGGYAVGLHGHPRYTGDIDIWVNPTPANAGQVVKAIEGFGFESLELTADDFIRKDAVIQLGFPPLRIDLLTTLADVSFSDCYKERVQVEVNGLIIDFIGKEGLIQTKLAAGRPRDLDDLEHLR